MLQQKSNGAGAVWEQKKMKRKEKENQRREEKRETLRKPGDNNAPSDKTEIVLDEKREIEMAR